MRQTVTPEKASGNVISITATPTSNITTINMEDGHSHSYSLDGHHLRSRVSNILCVATFRSLSDSQPYPPQRPGQVATPHYILMRSIKCFQRTHQAGHLGLWHLMLHCYSALQVLKLMPTNSKPIFCDIIFIIN